MKKKTLLQYSCQFEIDRKTQQPKETCQRTCRGPKIEVLDGYKKIRKKNHSSKHLSTGPWLHRPCTGIACEKRKENQGSNMHHLKNCAKVNVFKLLGELFSRNIFAVVFNQLGSYEVMNVSFFLFWINVPYVHHYNPLLISNGSCV